MFKNTHGAFPRVGHVRVCTCPSTRTHQFLFYFFESFSRLSRKKNLKKCDMTMVNSPVISAWGSLTANPKCSHHRPEKEPSTEEGGEHTQWLVAMFHDGHHKYICSLIVYALKDLGKKLLTLKKKSPWNLFLSYCSLLLLISVGEQMGRKTATLTPPSLPPPCGQFITNCGSI